VDLLTTHEQRDGWTVLHVHGEVDLTTVPALRSRVIDLLRDGGPHLIIDLDDVGHLDSTGLGVLLGAVRRARGAGGEVRFVSTRAPVQRLFEATGLDVIHPLAASVDDAVGQGHPGR
jgi:anti-sigma B factor antagonist